MQPSIQFRFNERKATAAACYLLDRAGGSMEFVRLIKLLYLAERRCLELHGRPLCGDKIIAMEHGPVMSEVYDRIKGIGPKGSPWQAAVKREEYVVTLLCEPDLGSLSRAELVVLEEVHKAHLHQGTWDLVRWVHVELPEWSDPAPAKSRRIEHEAILEALRKKPEEVEEIAASAREDAYFDDLFGVAR